MGHGGHGTEASEIQGKINTKHGGPEVWCRLLSRLRGAKGTHRWGVESPRSGWPHIGLHCKQLGTDTHKGESSTCGIPGLLER